MANQGPTLSENPHGPIYLRLGHEQGGPQGIGLPLVPVLSAFQVSEGVEPSFRVQFATLLLGLLGLHLKQDLMCALMCQGKATLAAQLFDLAGLQKAGVQKNLILFEFYGTNYSHFLNDVLGIGIAGQTANTSICRQSGKSNV